jgi:hypothetical protein
MAEEGLFEEQLPAQNTLTHVEKCVMIVVVLIMVVTTACLKNINTPNCGSVFRHNQNITSSVSCVVCQRLSLISLTC